MDGWAAGLPDENRGVRVETGGMPPFRMPREALRLPSVAQDEHPCRMLGLSLWRSSPALSGRRESIGGWESRGMLAHLLWSVKYVLSGDSNDRWKIKAAAGIYRRCREARLVPHRLLPE